MRSTDDGYRLTYGGLDYLALNTHRRNDTIYSLGNQIGVGKESDIYITASQENRQQVLKLHRLGRISFRSVKANRDYLRNRSTGSWMYLSRLAAQKEHAFMRVLHREGFPVPEPIAWSRHTVVMEFIDAFPLRMIDSVPEPGKLYGELVEMIVNLAKRGLIHGDFNEFNILIKEIENVSGGIDLVPILIDFPQTVSTSHVNAQMYFERDVGCVKRYFERRFKYVSDEMGPYYEDAVKGIDPEKRLDVEVEASGFSKKMAKELDRYVEAIGEDQLETTGDVSDHEESEDGAKEDDDAGDASEDLEDISWDRSLDNTGVADEIDVLTLSDESDIKGGGTAEYGLLPFDLPYEHHASMEKAQAKKKAAGWAI